MPRDIDHLVIAVRDLEGARDTYRRLGFTLTPVARHPFGTANSLVQLDACYLELIAVAHPAAIIEPAADTFSIGAFVRDFLKSREGPVALALKSADAAADRADFVRRGLPVYQPFHFHRNAAGPDGEERHVGFSLTFTSEPRLTEAAFFTCQHHHPENLWRPQYQRHANGALAIRSVIMVARDPADVHEFLTHFTGQQDINATSLAVVFDLGRSAVEVLSPVAFRAFFGEDAGPDPLRLTGLRIAVANLAATGRALAANRVPFAELSGALVVPSRFAHGAAIVFVAG